MRHCTHGLLHFLVRLACVRHAASVDSEPGSNSRLKPDDSPLDGRRGVESAIPRSKGGMAIHCEIARTCDSSVPRFPALTSSEPSHDWHVQPVVKDQIRNPPERRVSVELAIHSDSVSSKLVHPLRSSPTRRDEPFKLTVAVHVVSIFQRAKRDVLSPCSVTAKILAILRFPDCAIVSIAKSRNHEIPAKCREAAKDLCSLRRLLRLAKPFRAGCFASARLP